MVAVTPLGHAGAELDQEIKGYSISAYPASWLPAGDSKSYLVARS